MNQESLNKIKGSPEFNELKDFLRLKLLELVSLQGVPEITDPLGFALEVKARLRASQYINEILAGLVDLPTLKGHSNKDYLV